MDAHRVVAIVAATLMAGALTSVASAENSPVTGTISCSIASADSSQGPTGIRFHPFIDAEPRLVHVTGTNVESSCDHSGVTGGNAPITEVVFKLTGVMPDGTCAQFITTPTFKNASRIKLQFRGLNPGDRHAMTVTNAQGDVAAATYDSGSHALTITTGPLKGRGFAGATATLHLGFDPNSNISLVEAGCSTAGTIALGFGQMNPSTLDVQ